MSSSPTVSDESPFGRGAPARNQVLDVTLRRRNDPGHCCRLSEGAGAALTAFSRVIAQGKSEALLLWPLGIEGVAVFHALGGPHQNKHL